MIIYKQSKQFSFFFIIAFVLRAALFLFFIQPHSYYKQPDSTDYHNCALGITAGTGMHRVDSYEPIFWRTPGYPLYLSWFYSWYGLRSFDFAAQNNAHTAALWTQIIISSFIPIILYLLALTLTGNPLIAIISAWISVFHPGFILASSFLLTEGVALIFFFLFLLFLFRLILVQHKNFRWIIPLLCAVICLSIYTWIRPMGEFVGYATAVLLFCATAGSIHKKTLRALLFGILFFATLFPWYYRNYRLTDEWFFCPTLGTYLNVFNAPKILRRVTGQNILECHKQLGMQAAQEVRKKQNSLRGTGKFASNNVCKAVSVPVCLEHPWYFMYDWIIESCKTAFDLYSYQLVTMANGSWWYDPIEEYLPDKIAACLYAENVPWLTRTVSWLEFVFSLFILIGLCAGFWIFVLHSLIRKKRTHLLRPWLCSLAIIALCIGMTGGFGYARLRLPVEPLMIILSLTFWYWIYEKKK